MGLTFTESSAKLNITSEVDHIEVCLGTGFRFNWDRDGQVRRIPHPVMKNAVQLYRARQEMVHAGRAPQYEPAIIEWAQCVGD